MTMVMDVVPSEKDIESPEVEDSSSMEKGKPSWKRVVGIFILGQLLALLNSTSGLTSQFLTSIYSANIPCTQSLLIYVSLALVYLPWLVCTRKHGPLLRSRRWLMYAAISMFDFEGNYLIVSAFQYTNLLSIMLLDCFSIVVVMVLSFILMRLRYRWLHYISVIFCFVGIMILVLKDLINNAAEAGPKPWLGDLLVIFAATCYGLSNVGQEVMVKHFDIIEFLSMLGFFGTLYASIQLSILERTALRETQWTGATVGLLLAFTITLLLFYSFGAWLIRWSNATMYNLSLLASDIYGLVYGILIFHLPVKIKRKLKRSKKKGLYFFNF
jgi:solute carrier family 35 protein F1/2